MNRRVLVIASLAILIIGGWAVRRSSTTSRAVLAHSSSPVVVELFTSEGCSSCPPADKLLAQLDADKSLDGIPVIALSEHVDYWDGLGWKDRFSSRAFTERQSGYARTLRVDSPYTPQMVVDGRFELVGNDSQALSSTVHQAAATPKSAIVALNWTAPNQLQVSISNAPVTGARVLLAVTESGLTTTVDAGENGGRVLRHSGVVRVLRELGSTKDGHFSLSTPVTIDSAWDKKKLTAVAFVQDGVNGPVLGAASLAVQY